MRRLSVALVALALLVLPACTRGETAAWFAERELGRTEFDALPYMHQAQSTFVGEGPKFDIINGVGGTGFWCDEFAAEMLRRAGFSPPPVGDPADLARAYPLASPPYEPGDLVFVTFTGRDLHDHVGILQRADGDQLWTIDGNWSTGVRKENGKMVSGVVLNERWVGDGAVTEIRRPA